MLALNSGHTIRHVATSHLIWLCHGELPFKIVRDSNMFMTAMPACTGESAAGN